VPTRVGTWTSRNPSLSNAFKAAQSHETVASQTDPAHGPFILHSAAPPRPYGIPYVRPLQDASRQQVDELSKLGKWTGSRVQLRTLVPSEFWKLVRFGAVGVSGLVVNLIALAVLLLVPLDSLAVGGEVLSAVVSTQIAIAWNFLLTERWVFKGGRGSWRRRFLPFWAVSCAALLAQLPLAGELETLLGGSYLLATGIAIGMLMVGRFLVCDRWLYRRKANCGRRLAFVGPGS